MTTEILNLMSETNFTEGEENEKSQIKVIDRIELSKEINIVTKAHEMEINWKVCNVCNVQEFLWKVSRGGSASMSFTFDFKPIIGKEDFGKKLQVTCASCDVYLILLFFSLASFALF